MIKFLIQRPIAVIVAFVALFILGIIAYLSLPVSLLPSIAIPEMTVQISGDNMSARELENTVVLPIRQRLIQVSSLRDIDSEVRDESGTIRLHFEYGVNTDLAFIEVNEKIDAAMGSLPKDVSRPRVIKASATDIPVFYLQLTMHNDSSLKTEDEARFLDLSEFALSVLKQRLEQLPQVAMADISGAVEKQIRITPDPKMLEMTGITLNSIETALSDNNVEPGTMTVHDGHSEFNVKFSTLLRTVEDVANLLLTSEGRIYRLKEIARVETVPRKVNGISLYNGKRAVTLALIKQSSENMDDMKEEVQGVISNFKSIYPQIDFDISQNQTELLDYTISNLQQNLLLGFILICIVAFLFLGDKKSPLVISLSMLVSLVISFLFFYLSDLSFNVISLSGLILALGMMIDSSIIVTDNITQYRERLGDDRLDEVCEKGAGEVILPILSSSLTTVAIFVPLVFLSGIAGALFRDEAMSVTIGLAVSCLVGIVLLPVIYRLLYGHKSKKNRQKSFSFLNSLLSKRKDGMGYIRWYEKGINCVFNHKWKFLLLTLLFFPSCILLFFVIPKEKMPRIEQTELLVYVDWNENIHLKENRTRLGEMMDALTVTPMEYSSFVGRQDFLLNNERERGRTESDLYLRLSKSEDIARVEQDIAGFMKLHYPKAVFQYSPPETFFEKVFDVGKADLIFCLKSTNNDIQPSADSIRSIRDRLSVVTGIPLEEISFNEVVNISVDQEKLILYDVSESTIRQILQTAFQENRFAVLRSYQQYLPIVMSGKEIPIDDVLAYETVNIKKGTGVQAVPLQSFVKVKRSEELKCIVAGRDGEYIPFHANKVVNPLQTVKDVEKELSNHKEWECSFSGGYFDNKEMFSELIVVLLVALLLMYFIMTAQFESTIQPLIVLLEIPIDIVAALFVLWITGYSLNLMSAIGIVVTCGIVINDSILKLDVINRLRKDGVPLLEAIHEAGHRRIRAIIMTSLTTILAMVPLLFSFDLGSELQKPLSIAMISSMILGTLVSLFLIPLVYWMIYRNKAVTS